MSFLISAAHAAPAAGPTNGILPNILMIVVFVAPFISNLAPSSKTC